MLTTGFCWRSRNQWGRRFYNYETSPDDGKFQDKQHPITKRALQVMELFVNHG